MSARLAAFCLVNLVVWPAWGSPADQPETELVVYLTGASAQPERSLLYMKLELSSLMRNAGYRVEWGDPRTHEGGSTDAALVVVELRGTCEAGGARAAKLGPLASTATSGGQIIPFSSVDCAGLNRIVGAALSTEPPARREFLYGRAMARLAAHELYHILLRTGDHSGSGIARAAFTAADLLTEHFQFETATLAKLRPVAAASGVGEEGPNR